jgi:hypothetical protein
MAPPSALACLQDDFEACIAHLRFPLAHRRAIRTINLLERLFGEERRHTKVIPHAFGERGHHDRKQQTWRATGILETEKPADCLGMNLLDLLRHQADAAQVFRLLYSFRLDEQFRRITSSQGAAVFDLSWVHSELAPRRAEGRDYDQQFL